MNAKLITDKQLLTIGFICDADLKATCFVLERKGNFAIVLIDGLIARKKVYTSFDGDEFIYPYGKYSMCPTARP
jgi:hypothetical protein